MKHQYMVCWKSFTGLPDVDDPVALRRRSVKIMLGLIGQTFGEGEKVVKNLKIPAQITWV